MRLIVWHLNLFENKVFDVFVSKSQYKRFKFLKDRLYQVDCEIAKLVTQINPDLKYVGSEDFEHIPEFNEAVRELVEKLRRMKFREVDFTEIERKLIESTRKKLMEGFTKERWEKLKGMSVLG